MPISTSSSPSSNVGLTGGGHGAGGQRHPHAPPPAVGLAADGSDGGEILPRLGGGAAQLLDQHGDADPAAPGGVEAVLDGDVVVGHDRLHLGAGLGRQLGGHLEVHHVARVVLDDVDDAGAAVDETRGRQHLVGRR